MFGQITIAASRPYGAVGFGVRRGPLPEAITEPYRDGYAETYLPEAVTKLDLFNRVLDILGTRTSIESLSDGSLEATVLSRWYAPTVEWVLRYGFWQSAMINMPLRHVRTSPVPQLPTEATPAAPQWYNQLDNAGPGWKYAYEYPADCVKFLFVTANGEWLRSNRMPTKFEIAVIELPGPTRKLQRVVLTNQEHAIGHYVLRAPLEMWDEMLREAILAKLAANTAMALTGSQSLFDQLTKHAAQLIMEANAQAGNESMANPDAVPDWIMARGFTSGILPNTAFGASREET